MRGWPSLAYRQTLAAHKLVADVDGTPLYFPKENFSNGCIATVDVIYPERAVHAAVQPARCCEAQLQPVLDYARMGALEVAVRAARPGHVSAGQRPGLRRRRADRGEPDAGRRERQHADPDGGAGAGGGQRRLRRESTGRELTQVGRVPEGQGPRPGKPAFHRRFRRPPGAQREPLDQGDPGAGLVRHARRDDGPTTRRPRRTARRREEFARQVDRNWRPTATTTGWRSTSRAPGARSTTWCGTSCWG